MEASEEGLKLLNGDSLHSLIFKHMEELIESGDELGILETQRFMVNLKRDLLKRETLALGCLSQELADRADAPNGNAPDWFPEPPEWLEIWDLAVSLTGEEALVG